MRLEQLECFFKKEKSSSWLGSENYSENCVFVSDKELFNELVS